MLQKFRAIAIAGILGGAILLGAPSEASADASGICAHNDSSHWHGLTFDSVTYMGSSTYYSGSVLVHVHHYGNDYVAPFGGVWSDDNYNYCPLH